jgi:hypothetical protein
VPTVNRILTAKRIFLTGCLLLSSLTTAQAEEIYRWIDANGVVNYTQQKPRDIAAQQLTTQRGAPTRVESTAQPAQAAAAVNSDLDAAESELSSAQQEMLKDLRAAEAARQEEIAKVREANCQKSRALLSNLSAKDRIRVRDDNGTERIMAEDERQRKIEQAQKGIVENCASA